MKFCAELLGNLGRGVGGRLCVELEECKDVEEVVEELLRRAGAAARPDELMVIDEGGRALDGGKTTCEVSSVRVARLYRGG
ncbi:MAG: hypothetical protein ABWK00_03090 [Desulfurococcaceae archaeon]